jgi:hypothetical protein
MVFALIFIVNGIELYPLFLLPITLFHQRLDVRRKRVVGRGNGGRYGDASVGALMGV